MREIGERAFEFAVSVVKFCQPLLERPGVGRVLGHQLLRSGTAVGANLQEARAAQSKADFISKNAIALKESRETEYWMRLLAAAEIVPASCLAGLQIEANELTRIIAAIIVSAKKNNP